MDKNCGISKHPLTLLTDDECKNKLQYFTKNYINFTQNFSLKIVQNTKILFAILSSQNFLSKVLLFYKYFVISYQKVYITFKLLKCD